MGSAQERECYETGTEPEFVIFDVSRWEDAGDGLMRVYVVSKHGRIDKTEYCFVLSPERLSFICRKAMMFAAEAHTIGEFRAAMSSH